MALFTLTACNTVKGVAKDVQSGARAIERAADDAASGKASTTPQSPAAGTTDGETD